MEDYEHSVVSFVDQIQKLDAMPALLGGWMMVQEEKGGGGHDEGMEGETKD